MEKKQKIHKILIVQIRQIGDVLTTFPLIKALRGCYPKASIDIMVDPISEDLARAFDLFDMVIPFPTNMTDLIRFIAFLRKQNYDMAIDFLGIPKSAWIARLSGAKEIIGFRRRGRTFLYNKVVEMPGGINKTIVWEKEKLINAAYCHQKTEERINLKLSQEIKSWAEKKLNIKKGERIITISPQARRHYKAWPFEYHAQLGDYIREKTRARVIVLWGPGEYKIAQFVAEAGNLEIAPKTPTIMHLYAIISHSFFHFGNDNSHRHFAYAADIPTFTVFGRSNHNYWPDWESGGHDFILAPQSCKICRKKRCQSLSCLEMLKPEMVKEKLGKMKEFIHLFQV